MLNDRTMSMMSVSRFNFSRVDADLCLNDERLRLLFDVDTLLVAFVAVVIMDAVLRRELKVEEAPGPPGGARLVMSSENLSLLVVDSTPDSIDLSSVSPPRLVVSDEPVFSRLVL